MGINLDNYDDGLLFGLQNRETQSSAESSGFFDMNNLDTMSLGMGAAVGIVALVVVTKLYTAAFSSVTKPMSNGSSSASLTRNSLSRRRPSHSLDIDFSSDGPPSHSLDIDFSPDDTEMDTT